MTDDVDEEQTNVDETPAEDEESTETGTTLW